MFEHQPVLLQEVLQALTVKSDGIYIDATFGRGGHSREILKLLGSEGRLMVIDKDPEAIKAAQTEFGQDSRVIIRQGAFSQLEAWCGELDWLGKVAGILVDLGVSSPQLDDPERGFSFLRDGPLDMRMDPTMGMDATSWLGEAREQEIAEVLRTYGEERYARRIARAIVMRREERAFTRTGDLAEVIARAHPRWERFKHPATRSFQAIRIFVNGELDELETFLAQSLKCLAVGGRLCAISFHSLEDRIVKRFIQRQEKGEDLPFDLPIRAVDINQTMRRVGKAVRADDIAVKANPRARSAVLRIAEKIA